MSTTYEVIFSRPQATYLPATYCLQPAAVGAGYQSLAMKATKVHWPRGVADLFVGHINISHDGGQSWRHLATWRDDGQDVWENTTEAALDHSFLNVFFSARPDMPVFTQENTWVRGIFECRAAITTAITIERA